MEDPLGGHGCNRNHCCRHTVFDHYGGKVCIAFIYFSDVQLDDQTICTMVFLSIAENTSHERARVGERNRADLWDRSSREKAFEPRVTFTRWMTYFLSPNFFKISSLRTQTLKSLIHYLAGDLNNLKVKLASLTGQVLASLPLCRQVVCRLSLFIYLPASKTPRFIIFLYSHIIRTLESL